MLPYQLSLCLWNKGYGNKHRKSSDCGRFPAGRGEEIDSVYMNYKSGCIAAASIFLLAAGFVNIRSAQAFHDGGVGTCDSCHTMHRAKDGNPAAGKKSQLLVAADPSSVCLNCHAGSGGADSSSVFSMDGSAMAPGGDFYWLTKTFTWSGGASSGDSHGHNVVAVDFNLGQDLRLFQSPGGSYRSEYLSCTSCHDPHGKTRGGTKLGALPISVSGSYGELPAESTGSGNYRLLGDSHYGGGGAAQGFQFFYDAPVARQNILHRFGESDGSHVDYGTGMSEWCGNCHESILRDDHAGAGNLSHPAGSSGTLSNETVSMYNTYINTGDLTENGTGTGDIATAYLQFIPFERGTDDPQLLDPTSKKGPNTSSRIICLTCHRAHASAFRSIGRWDFDAVMLADSHPAASDGGIAGNDVLHSYYGRNIPIEFGPDQGPFCEKCHGLNLGLLETGSTDQELDLEPGHDPLPAPGLEEHKIIDPLLQYPFNRRR